MKTKKEIETEVYFHISEELKKEIKIMATREGRSMKEMWKEMAEEYVKVHQKGNPQHLITLFTENEDIAGFPSMGISMEKKQAYTKNFIEDHPKLAKELYWHVQEWSGLLSKL